MEKVGKFDAYNFNFIIMIIIFIINFLYYLNLVHQHYEAKLNCLLIFAKNFS